MGEGEPRQVRVRPPRELRPGPHLPHGPAVHPGRQGPERPENGWDKTWAYLKELGQYVDNYPTGTGQVMTNMADGTWS